MMMAVAVLIAIVAGLLLLRNRVGRLRLWRYGPLRLRP